jgi:hypothetical protein
VEVSLSYSSDIIICRDLLVESVNPLYLRGLKQALYILHNLEEGQTNDQIIQRFEGDSQLVEIWTTFLVDNYWITKNELGGMAVTEKGILCLRKYGSIDADSVHDKFIHDIVGR